METDKPHRDTMSLRLDGTGIVRLAWTPGLRIDEDLAEEAMRAVNELNDGAQRPLYVTMADCQLTRGARQVFVRPCSASRTALVGKSPVDRVVANFFVGVSSLPMPIRFFTSESAAIAWLTDGQPDPGV